MNGAIYFRKRAGRAAFTQVEFLVLVMVVAMLAMIGLSASARLSNQTKIAQCSNNLRQLNLSQLLYAADNSDKLPAISGAASWPWDMSVPVAAALSQYGAVPKTMYCPGTAPRFTDEQNFASANSLWNFGGTGTTGYHIIGYSLTLGNSRVASTNQNFTVTPQPIAIGSSVIPQRPSQRVLTADAILSAAENSNFVLIYGGFMQNGVAYPHLSPHLDGVFPVGCNVAMLDGHVEWRPFKQMRIRTPLGSPPYFYW